MAGSVINNAASAAVIKPPRRWRLGRWLGLAALVVVLAGAGYWLVHNYWGRNFEAVVAGQVYRAAQPSAAQLEQWSKRYGIRTDINLRGQGFHDFDAEQATAERLGMKFVPLRFEVRRPPTVPMMHRLIDALDNAPRPILLHCRAGVDRSGMASVLAAMAVGNLDYRTARQQLSIWSWRPNSAAGHVDNVFDDYDQYCTQHRLAPGGWTQFRQWAMQEYHPSYYRVRLELVPALAVAPGQAATVDVRVTNTSIRRIPLSDPARRFQLGVFRGDTVDTYPEEIFGMVDLPRHDLEPGQSIQLTLPFTAPPAAGVYDLSVDLVEHDRTWFGRQGSPVSRLRVTVAP